LDLVEWLRRGSFSLSDRFFPGQQTSAPNFDEYESSAPSSSSDRLSIEEEDGDKDDNDNEEEEEEIKTLEWVCPSLPIKDDRGGVLVDP